jgi:hypothetical protein
MKKRVKTNCACEMERKWNGERPRERCTDEVAGGLKIMGMRWPEMASNTRELSWKLPSTARTQRRGREYSSFIKI